MKMNDKYMGRKDYNISKKKNTQCTQETLVLVLTLLLIGCVTLGEVILPLWASTADSTKWRG